MRPAILAVSLLAMAGAHSNHLVGRPHRGDEGDDDDDHDVLDDTPRSGLDVILTGAFSRIGERVLATRHRPALPAADVEALHAAEAKRARRRARNLAERR
jgi:hypothetical protein